ncbi:MAG: CPBP family intramembrane metalloprotease [bacterium]|nr:CPBP family intramembrane metalloprotease [bacterium]
MENNSTSTISAAWPTRWPNGSFRALPTLALVGIIIVVAVVVLTAAAVALRATIVATQHVPLVPAIVSQLVLEVLIVVAILIAMPRVSGFSLRELGFRRITLGQIGIALLGAILMIAVVEGGASLVEALTHTKHEQSVVEMFRAIHNPATSALFVVFATVLAPVAEETIFRVFLFNLGLRYGGFPLGALVSGVLFGLAHGDAFVFVPLALGGAILCGVYYYSRNAYASMITHACFNTVTVLALLFAPKLAS